MNLSPDLARFASPAQDRYLEAVLRLGSCRAAARDLGVHNATVSRCIKALQDKAASQGYSPDHDMTHVVPDGFRVKGVSSFYNCHGELTGQLVNSTTDHERREELLSAAVDAMTGEEHPLPTLPAPEFHDRKSTRL